MRGAARIARANEINWRWLMQLKKSGLKIRRLNIRQLLPIRGQKETIDPKLEDMRDSVEPLGDLAERIPGNRKRRRE